MPKAGQWNVKAGLGTELADYLSAQLESKLLGVRLHLYATEPADDEDTEPFDLAVHHAVDVDFKFDATYPVVSTEAMPVDVGGTKGLLTISTQPFPGGERKRAVWTFPILSGRSAMTAAASGYSGDLKAALPGLSDLIGSMRIRPRPMRVSIEAAGAYINHLYGFSINSRLDESGKAGEPQVDQFKDETPEALAGHRLELSIGRSRPGFRLWVVPTGVIGVASRFLRGDTSRAL